MIRPAVLLPLVAAALALVGAGARASDGSGAPAPAAAEVAAPLPAAAPALAEGSASAESGAPSAAADASASVPAPAPAQRAEPLRLEPSRTTTLLPLVQPLWSELSPAQQQVLQPFAAQWNALPLTEKRAWADLARRFPKMKPDEQRRVEKRIAEWAALTPEQRRIARQNYQLAQQAARERLLAEWENYQSMTPEQRSVLGTVGSTSNTAARHVATRTGLAREAAQPLPRRTPSPPVAGGADGTTVPSGRVAPTVGPVAPR